jgi:uncharacterized membrane protein
MCGGQKTSLNQSSSNKMSRVWTDVQIDLLICLALLPFFRLMIELVPTSLVQWVIGACFILFPHGYIASLALFPARNDLDLGERVTLSLVFSVVILPVLLYMLNYTCWGIGLDSIFLVAASLDLVVGVIAWIRRNRLVPQQRFMPCFHLGRFQWAELGKRDQFLYLLLLCSMLIAIGTMIYLAVMPRIGERFTEFYILGPGEVFGGYSRDVIAGESIFFVIEVINHEHSDVQYRVMKSGDVDDEQIASFQLSHQEKWKQLYVLTLGEPGENRRVTFLLYRGDDDEPYRSLHLWITVKEKTSAQ